MALRCQSSQLVKRSSQSVARAFGVPHRTGVRTTAGRTARAVEVKALFQPGGNKDRKFITREEEPEEYWVSKGEQAGSNPFKDPIAIVGIIAIFFPFIFLLIAIATGAVDISVYR